MKLLFDENLSPQLPRLLEHDFPASAHVRNVGLLGAEDDVIWQLAREEGFVLVTKDDDFTELSVLRGPPPKLVRICLGNCRTADVVALLVGRRAEVERFGADDTTSLLELG